MIRLALLAIFLTFSAVSGAQPTSVVVEALLPNTAVVQINGARKTLRAGQAQAGVKLIQADSRSAVIEIDGRRQTVKLHDRISGSYAAPKVQKVDIPRTDNMQYLTTASINGFQVRVLVDTGANIILLNSSHARAAGIDYKAGMPSTVTTASEVVSAWFVKLPYVDVGGIRVDNINATVTEGGFPDTPLLGMTFLKHVNMSESNGILTLSRDW